MKINKIHILSVLCLIFFACNNGASDDETEGTAKPSSSSKLTFSSSSEGGSSSSEIKYHPCKPFLSKYSMLSKDTLYFNKQGGIDTVVTGIKILFEDFSKKLDYESNEYAYKYLDRCEFSLTDHYAYRNDYSKKTKIESDYCKNNYCDNDDEKSYGNSPYHVPVMKMECPWFSVTQISKDSVQVSADKNETGKERSQYIPFTTGGCALSTFNLIIIQTSAP